MIITTQLITDNHEFTETSIYFDLNHVHSDGTLLNTKQV